MRSACYDVYSSKGVNGARFTNLEPEFCFFLYFCQRRGVVYIKKKPGTKVVSGERRRTGKRGKKGRGEKRSRGERKRTRGRKGRKRETVGTGGLETYDSNSNGVVHDAENARHKLGNAPELPFELVADHGTEASIRRYVFLALRDCEASIPPVHLRWYSPCFFRQVLKKDTENHEDRRVSWLEGLVVEGISN